LGISRRVALGGGLSVVLMTLVVMVSLQGRGRDSTQSVVPADTSTVSVPRPVAAQPNADSLVASRAADSTHRADSIMVAAKKQRAADSIALAVRRQRTADSIRLAAARRSDSISRLAKSGPTKSGPATTTQSGRAVAQAPVDPPKTAASIPELRNPGSAYPTNNTTVNPVPPPTAPKPTFQAAAASELQRFADFFPAADRRAVQRALGAEETDRIWRKLDGHPQISAAAKIVDTNLRDSTATFFLVITDRASRADLVSGEYKASFNPIPGGLRLFTAAPTRR
jgi:hypothetical protein